jgi:hypothetical protein
MTLRNIASNAIVDKGKAWKIGDATEYEMQRVLQSVENRICLIAAGSALTVFV